MNLDLPHTFLVLHSLKAVNKGAAPFSGGAGRSAPHPRLGPGVEPPGTVGRRPVNFLGVNKGLAGEGFPAQQPPPGFYQIQPSGLDRNE
jgi:hypothetical protein